MAYALTLGIRGSNVFRTVFFVPNLVGGIILGYIWQYIFNGILQYYGTNLALNANFGFWGLVILMCWQQAGYMMIIYIAVSRAYLMIFMRRLKLTAQAKTVAYKCNIADDDAFHHNLHIPYTYKLI